MFSVKSPTLNKAKILINHYVLSTMYYYYYVLQNCTTCHTLLLSTTKVLRSVSTSTASHPVWPTGRSTWFWPAGRFWPAGLGQNSEQIVCAVFRNGRLFFGKTDIAPKLWDLHSKFRMLSKNHLPKTELCLITGVQILHQFEKYFGWVYTY